MERRYPEKVWVYLLGGMGCTIVMISIYKLDFLPFHIGIYIALCYSYSCKLYNYKENRKVPFSILYGVISATELQCFGRLVQKIIVLKRGVDIHSTKLLEPVATAIIAIMVVLVYRIAVSVHNLVKQRKVTFFEVLSILVIMPYDFCCIKLVWIIYCNSTAYRHKEVEILLLLLGMVVINIFFLSYTSNLYHSNELRYRLEMKKNEETISRHYYESLELNYYECKRTLHDIKNHMQILEALYQAGDYEAATAYERTLNNEITRIYPKEYSSNKMLNIIFYNKHRNAEKYGIEVQFTIEDVTLDYIDKYDLTTIFCNIFDNAITCLRQLPNKERWIVVKLRKVNGFDMIFMANPMNEESKHAISKKVFYRQVHSGTGLNNVRRVVNKYKGNYSFDVVDGEFHVSIYFCK